MYRFKHVAISNVCEESPARQGFFLPAVGRMTFTKAHSPIILTPPLSAELTILARFVSSQPVRCDIAALRTTFAAKLADNKTLFCHSEPCVRNL